MPKGPEPLCFTCGLPIGDPFRLNHLPGGQVCPSCRDRLLDSLPAPFPRRQHQPDPAAQGDPDLAYDEPETGEAWGGPPPGSSWAWRPRDGNEPA
jgi:hypothetical protein